MVTFINKDASSGDVSRSTYAERRRINEQSREHRVSARLARARASVQASSSAQSRQGEDQAVTANWSMVRARTSRSPGQVILSFSSDPVLITTEEGRRVHDIPQPGPGSTVDPFRSTAVPFNSYILQILRYFKEVYHDSLWATINAILRDRIDISYLLHCTPETIILECMEDRTRMYCLLADVGCHMEGGSFNTINRESTGAATTWTRRLTASEGSHMTLVSRGTEALRRELSSRAPSDIDSNILVEAFHLYMAATTISSQDAAQAHMAGVKAIIRDIVRRGIPINVVNAAMLALVDLEMSLQLLSEMDLRSLTSPKAPIYVPVTSLETVQTV